MIIDLVYDPTPQGEDVLPLAARKDAELTPGQLAWVLSQAELGDDAQIPGGTTVAELRVYVQNLQARLTRRAFPRA